LRGLHDLLAAGSITQRPVERVGSDGITSAIIGQVFRPVPIPQVYSVE